MRSVITRQLSLFAALVLASIYAVGCQQTEEGETRPVANPDGLEPMESFTAMPDGLGLQNARTIGRLAPPLRLAWAEASRHGRISGALDQQLHTWNHRRAGLMVDIIVRGESGDIEVVGRLRDAGMAISSVMSGPALVLGSAPVNRLAEISAVDGVVAVEMARQMQLRTSQSIDAGAVDALTGAPVASMNLTRGLHANGEGVVVGVIDTGIDFRHQDFLDADGNTRVEYIWDQTDCADSSPPVDTDGVSFGCVGDPDSELAACGSEYTRTDIDCTLDADGDTPCTSGYTAVLQEDFDGHGTHVASTAAGNGGGSSFVGVAPAADLIIVKFDFDNECNRNSSTAIIEGIRYIFDRAGDRPAVVNMSLGSDAGPHTGLTGEETGINALTGPGRLVMVAAGNAARSWNDDGDGVPETDEVNEVFGFPIHGTGTITEGESSPITLNVPKNYDEGPMGENYIVMDLWYGLDDPALSNVNVRVSPPARNERARRWYLFESSPDPAYGTCQELSTGRVCVFHSHVVGDTYWDLPAGTVDNEIWLQIDDEAGAAPASGEWRIEIEGVDMGNDVTLSAEYHSWLLTSRSLGLVSSTYGGVGADSAMTIGNPATASEVIAVAAYTTRSGWYDVDDVYQEYGLEGSAVGYYDGMPLNDLCFFSSRGPMRGAGAPLKPEIAAPGGGIVAAFSSSTLLAEWADPGYFYPGRVLVDGEADTGLNAYAVLQGTSMATPHATGAVAVLLQRDGAMTPDGLRAVLADTAAEDDLATAGTHWGFGRFDIDGALDAIPCATNEHCDDGNACNGVETCVLDVCEAGSVPGCVDADGCCPAGCDDTTDTDCDPVVVEEDCVLPGDEDGDGFADCDDPDCADDPICAPACDDADGDGYDDESCGGDDCDDSDPDVNPGATEVCEDGVDNDCVDGDAVCGCGDVGDPCSSGSDCCSGSCHPRKGCR